MAALLGGHFSYSPCRQSLPLEFPVKSFKGHRRRDCRPAPGVSGENGRREKELAPPHHEYTEHLLASVPEMDPDWLDNLLEERG
jgi:hypothetical protein